MLMCLEENCICDQHLFLMCLENEENIEAQLLLQKLENVSQLIDNLGCTLLHYSAKFDNAEMTQHLINQGCYVDAPNDAGITPLMLSMNYYNLGIAEILLKNNAVVYVTDSRGTNIFQLVFRTCLDTSTFVTSLQPELKLIVDMLFEKLHTDFSQGRRFLLNANLEFKLAVLVFGNAEVTKFVLDNGYPIDFHESHGRHTALHGAVVCARLDNAKMLIEHGADVDAMNELGHSPLRHYARHFERVDENCEVLKIFLKRSRALSMPRLFSGETDVECLLWEGSENTVRTVLESDVDVDACCLKHKSILDYLMKNRRIDNLDFLNEFDVKFDVNERSETGSTALTEAFRNVRIRKIEFLLEHGADVNVTTDRGISPLYSAMMQPDSVGAKVMELLLLHGADVQSFLVDIKPRLVDQLSPTTGVVVAHLAMLEATKKASLTESSRSRIDSNPLWKAYFDVCARQLDEMKSCEVHGTVTLFKLLTDTEEKLVAYARNEELRSAFDGAMDNSTRFEKYYVSTLQKRFSKAQEVGELQDKAAGSIEKLTGRSTGVYRAVAYDIINYLDRQDLRNLCQIGSIPSIKN